MIPDRNLPDCRQRDHALMGGLPTETLLRRRKILVVEDDLGVAELLQLILSIYGEVDAARNGAEALAHLAHAQYTLIVCDINMPVMDGISFYREAVLLNPDIGRRILFYTGDGSYETVSFFKKHRLSYLTKPATLVEIRRKAADILNPAPVLLKSRV
jgi:CheY-like chemotaxis protein